LRIDNNMNLYYFNPGGYGNAASVCAESREKAREYLKATPVEKYWSSSEPSESIKEGYARMIESMITDYDIEEHPVGEVVFSENC